MKTHLAEMLLDIKYRGPQDRVRKRYPFSENVEATHSILFNPRYDKRTKIRAYRNWLESNQPCVFGRVAAKNKNVFICLLEEREILTMRRGDDDLLDTIQDYRQAWKRHALEGLSSSFLILLSSRSLVDREPNDRLKEIARRLLELYMEVERIEDDTIVSQREYVFLRRESPKHQTKLLKFSTLPNVFCAQGDQRWWQDHRTPGGVMITSNSLGHFVYSRTGTEILSQKDKVQALDNAMRTIGNAHSGSSSKRSVKLRHCPATRLVPLLETEESPLRESSDFRKYSPDHYEGYFHTDHLVPSVFFRNERNPKDLKLYSNLSLRYIFDPDKDATDHAELMTGLDTSWYELRRNIDRLPAYVNPERSSEFSPPLRAQLAKWLDARLKARLEA